MERGLIFFTKGVGKGLPAEYTLLSNSEAKIMAKKWTGEMTERLTDGENTHYKKNKIEEEESPTPTPEKDSHYLKFHQWLSKECPNVAKMPLQMTEIEFEQALLLFDNDGKKMSMALKKMNNSKSCVERHYSVFVTLKDWKQRGYFENIKQ